MQQDFCDEIKKNIEDILNTIQIINNDVTLVAVSKTFSADHIRCAISAGLKTFGENKIQEAGEKISLLNSEFEGLKWHYIGHLQTNKVNKAIQLFDLIQAVDSLKLARKISESSAREGISSDILLELKVSSEETKFGVDPEDAVRLAGEIAGLDNVRLRGAMAMAPYFEEPEKSRPYFKKAKNVFDEIKRNVSGAGMEFLSMGMTNDYKVAIEEGANIVRVGSGIFGNRTY